MSEDERDRGVRQITAPTLAVWSAAGSVASWYDPLSIWRSWAPHVEGDASDAGHFLAEEAPIELAERLTSFLSS